MISYNPRKLSGKAGPALCRNRDEVERQRNRLWLLYELQNYHFLKSLLDKGLAQISSDPSLEEEPVRQAEHIIFVHKQYW